MRTTSIADAGDWTIPVHRALLSWLRDNVPSEDAIREIVIAYQSWRRQGYWSISTRRLDATASSAVRRHVLAAVRACPYISRVASHIPGRHSVRYRFSLPGAARIERSGIDFFDRVEAPTDSGYVWRVARGWSVDMAVPHTWMVGRARKWVDFCDKIGARIPCDFFGASRVGRAVFGAIDRVCVPTDLDWIATGDAEKSRWREWYHSRCLDGRHLRMLRTRRGRMYHPLTSCPRDLRSRLTVDGERLVEVDLSASYWTLLVGQMWDGPERDRAVEAIQSGRWYEILADAAGMGGTPRKETKIQTQIQCLFWRMRHPGSARPLWRALRRLYPGLARLIESVRERAGGATGLSDYVTWRESQVMWPVYEQLAAEGVPLLPLHDAVLVGESHAAHAAELVRSHGRGVLGYTPRVSPV